MNGIKVFTFALSIFASLTVFGSDQASTTPMDGQTMRLWSSDAPEAHGKADVDIPTLTAILPPKDKANGAAFIVCPGGGYIHLSAREGLPVARWLNSLGISAYVLKYRLGPAYHHPAEMDDVQRAIRVVRSNAQTWGLDPKRIGIIGFSAGGHLASTAATHFDNGREDAPDEIDRSGCRPDLAILVYPVISMVDPYVHTGSRQNLLGDHPDAKLEEFLSNERQVTPQTPPCFLVTSADDHVVRFENSLVFAMACRKNGVGVELHVFEHGPHGFALGGDDPILKTWTEIATGWLGRHGFTRAKSAH